MGRGLAATAFALAAFGVALAPGAAAAGVRVGAGRADMTGLTGGFKGGWACACARAMGQHTRLFARAIVLEQGAQKVALVAVDFSGPGMDPVVASAAALLGDVGFSQQNILVSATHTHGDASLTGTFPKQNDPTAGDPTGRTINPALAPFLGRQLAAAIRRANADLAPGAIGWGHTELLGVTRNRSLEAYLANFGIEVPYGQGRLSQAPHGYPGTIDPAVDVLRVDKLVGRRHVPIGMFSTFANHGTVVRPTFDYFTADHQGAAERVVEASIRGTATVPAGQEVVNAFGNGAEGDMSAGLDDYGPAYAERVGRLEAGAMLTAWREAGRAMTSTPALDRRWTRVCFCGQNTALGPVDSVGLLGLAASGGSEELRTIFQDPVPTTYEGKTLPADAGPQGKKIVVATLGSVKAVVPLTVMRIADRMVVSLPGEMTVEMGRHIREAVRAASAGAVKGVVLAGLSNAYLNYFATPEEYERQHYEGGFTIYGHFSALVVQEGLADLAARLVAGRPAPEPYDQGAKATTGDARFAPGATSASVVEQPRPVTRFERASFAWRGGPNGQDRPVDSAFVSIQRQVAGGWQTIADDLGMQIAWRSDGDGNYRAMWEVARWTRPGVHRFLVTAGGYRLASEPFDVARSAALTVQEVAGPEGRRAVRLLYPPAVPDRDFTYRPEAASGGRLRVRSGGRTHVVQLRSGTDFVLPAGRSQVIPAGGARDRYGNTNARPLVLGPASQAAQPARPSARQARARRAAALLARFGADQ
jgi:hypothetical protein